MKNFQLNTFSSSSFSPLRSENLTLFVGGPQFTAFGESPHHARNRELIAANVYRFAEKGIKHIFLEIGTCYQKAADEYMRTGNKAFLQSESFTIFHCLGSAEKKERTRKAGIELLVSARKANVSVHFIDQLPVMTATQQLQEDFEKLMALDSDLSRHAFYCSLSPERIDALLAFTNDIREQRIAADTVIAQNVLKRAGPDRAVILFGDRHLRSKNGIVEALGAGKTSYIRLEQESNFIAKSLPDDILPDVIYNMASNHMRTPPKERSLNLSGQRNFTRLSL